jgi:modulator of FtsH protease HflK
METLAVTMQRFGTQLARLLTARTLLAAFLTLLLVDWAITGITVIREDEQGVVTRFGAVTHVAPAGILFTLPWPIEQVTALKTTEVRTMPVGYKLVDAVRGIPPSQKEIEWVSGDQNIIDLTLTFKYAVSNPVEYLYNVGEREADFLVRRCAEAELTRLIATMTVDEILTSGKIRIQEETRQQTQLVLDKLGAGLRIVSVNIGSVEPPSTVIETFNDVATAKLDKAKLINQADGYQKDLIPRARAQADRLLQEAESYRTATLSQARSDSTRFHDLLTEALKAREITETRLYLETIETILANSRKVIIGDGESGQKLHLRR